jgi:hypothetical protein
MSDVMEDVPGIDDRRDKIYMDELPPPRLNVWREITQPMPTESELKVWKEHMLSLGTNDVRVDAVRGKYILMARRTK